MRHARTERERACDDLVLATGTPGTDYADQLLEIARVMRAGRFPALITGATLAMAHRSQLEGRLIAILDPKTPRTGLSGLRTAMATALAACAIVPACRRPTVDLRSGRCRFRRQFRHRAERQPDRSVHAESNARADADANAVSHADTATDAEPVAGHRPRRLHGKPRAWPDRRVTPETVGAITAGVEHSVKEALEASGHDGQEKSAKADPRMIAALTAALKDADSEVREAAMQALVSMRDPSIFEPLVQALSDSSPDVREHAAQALGQLKDKRALQPLTNSLKDANASVREQSAFALGQLRDPSSVPRADCRPQGRERLRS